MAKKPARNRIAAQSGGAVLGWMSWLVPVTIGVVTLIAFLPALQNGFLAWDDEEVDCAPWTGGS